MNQPAPPTDETSSEELAPHRSWLQTLVEAVRGSDQDFTKGSLSRAIVLLAVPMVLEMAMESVFAVCDVFFVGRLGPEAIATVGLTEALLTIIYAISVGLAMGTTALVARRFGEKDPEAAASTTVQAIVLGACIALAIGLAGSLMAPRLLAIMGASEGVIATGSGYTRILLASNIVIMLLFLHNAAFRGAGDASVAMRSLWIANLINIVLDPCLIFGLGPFPELGVTGAAIATTIGRGTGVLYQFYHLGRGNHRLAIARRHLRIVGPVIGRLFRVSFGGILQSLIGVASWVALVRITADFGDEALAGYTIAIRIIIFALLPSWGLSNAAATLVGQNLGAGNPDRAEKSVWLTGLYNMAFLGVVTVVFVALARPIVGIFTPDPGVLEIGIEGLRLISYGYIFYAWGLVLVQSFNGAGDTMTPTWVNFFCFWVFQIPVAWLLAYQAGLGPRGVFIAIAAGYSVSAVVGAILFRRGSWKNKVV